MLLIGELTERMSSQSLSTTEHEIIVDLVPKRTLLGRRYYVPVRQKLRAIFPSCTFLLTQGGMVGHHKMEHFVDGKRCTDKKGRPIGGWRMVTDIGQLTMSDLERINKDLAKACAS